MKYVKIKDNVFSYIIVTCNFSLRQSGDNRVKILSNVKV